MEIQKTTGIVLSSSQYGEADILCKILTEDFGKRSFIFKGLQKSKNRNKAAVETGSISNLVYYYHQEKSSHIVKEFSTKKFYPSIRDDLEKIYNSYFILEIVEKTSGFEDHNPALFNLLLRGIEALAETKQPVFFSSFFIIHLLKLHGILPSFEQCKKCGSTTMYSFSFDANDLRITCNACDNQKKYFSNSTREFLRQSLSSKFHAMEFSRYNKEEILQLLYTLHIFIENYFQVKIKSGRFVYNPSPFSVNRTGIVNGA